MAKQTLVNGMDRVDFRTYINDNFTELYDKTVGGSSSAIATGGTIAHGLSSAPNFVSVTPKDSGVTDFYVTADATNLTVTYSGGGTHVFWWTAGI